MHYIKRHDAVDLCGGEVCHSRDVEILESKLTEAEQENKRLRDTLEFYADENNYNDETGEVGEWQGRYANGGWVGSDFIPDKGERAREVLDESR